MEQHRLYRDISCTCTKDLKSMKVSCNDPPRLEEHLSMPGRCFHGPCHTKLFVLSRLLCFSEVLEWFLLCFDHNPEVQRGENASSPLQNHPGIPEERQSLSREAELLLGCCCHLLPTWNFAARDLPSLWPMERENAGIQEFRSGLVFPQWGWCVPWRLPLQAVGVDEGC